jgi:hypothetical protein
LQTWLREHEFQKFQCGVVSFDSAAEKFKLGLFERELRGGGFFVQFSHVIYFAGMNPATEYKYRGAMLCFVTKMEQVDWNSEN